MSKTSFLSKIRSNELLNSEVNLQVESIIFSLKGIKHISEIFLKKFTRDNTLCFLSNYL